MDTKIIDLKNEGFVNEQNLNLRLPQERFQLDAMYLLLGIQTGSEFR